MTEDQMMELIDSWENLNFLLSALDNQPENINILLNIALYSNHPKSWRAAWLMDKIHDKSPERINPFISEIIERLKIENNNGKKRHLLKLVSLNKIPEQYLGFLTDYCIEKFTSSKEPIAVRVHAMQVLHNVAVAEPELKPEIILVIEQEIENDSSAGILSRGKKLINDLSGNKSAKIKKKYN